MESTRHSCEDTTAFQTTTHQRHPQLLCLQSQECGWAADVFFAHEESVFSRVSIPAHLRGWNHVAHGGVVSTLLDETMYYHRS